eukprot:scaffold527_cov368-Prasinococcus_capsulatus_cf.AAC.33
MLQVVPFIGMLGGWALDGEEFDKTPKAEDGSLKPSKAKIGSKRLFPGVELALKSMCVGEKAAFRIPPELAFNVKTSSGNQRFSDKQLPVPRESILEYEIELVRPLAPKVVKPRKPQTRPDASQYKGRLCAALQLRRLQVALQPFVKPNVILVLGGAGLVVGGIAYLFLRIGKKPDEPEKTE